MKYREHQLLCPCGVVGHMVAQLVGKNAAGEIALVQGWKTYQVKDGVLTLLMGKRKNPVVKVELQLLLCPNYLDKRYDPGTVVHDTLIAKQMGWIP